MAEEIKSSLINDPDFKSVKASIETVSEKDGETKFRVKCVEYVNDSSNSNDDEFFFDMVEFIRFLWPEDESIAYTTPDRRIFLNAPNKNIDGFKQWDFIYDHECLHQLWETFKVEERIKKEKGECDHMLLNIASDCVINDYLYRCRKKSRPENLVTPERLKEEFGVEYDPKNDTQFTLYLKLDQVKEKILKDQQIQKDMEKFDKKIKPKSIKQVPPQPTPPGGGKIPEEYKKGRHQGIKDVLDKKVDPLKYKPKKPKNLYDQGYEDVIEEIKKGLTDGIKVSQQQQQGGGGGDSLEKVPWDIPQNQQQQQKQQQQQGGGSGDGDSKSGDQKQQKDNKSASDAASSAKQAQDSADKAKKAASDSKSQDAADKAQEAADKAKEAAEKAADAADKGDKEGEEKYAKEAQKQAEEAAKQAAAAGADSTGSNNAKDASGAASAAKKAKELAEQAKEAASKAGSEGSSGKSDNKSDSSDGEGGSKSDSSDGKSGSKSDSSDGEGGGKSGDKSDSSSSNGSSDKSNSSSSSDSKGGKSGDKAKDAADAAKKAAEMADKAAEAAEKAAECAEHGDKEGEEKYAKEAQKYAEEAERYAKDAGVNTQKGGSDSDSSSSNSNQSNSTPPQWGTGHVDTPDIEEDLEKLKHKGDEIIKKYTNKITGTFGEFIEKCKKSVEMDKDGLGIYNHKAGPGWAQQMNSQIIAFVKKKVFQKKRMYKKTYRRVNRHSGFIKDGDPINPGRKIREEKLTIDVAFYLDRSGSMGGDPLKNVFKASYTIADILKKQFAKESVVDNIEFKMYAFDDVMTSVKWGNVASAGGGTMAFHRILDYIKDHTADYLINIIMTDAGFDVQPSEVDFIIKHINGMLMFIPNTESQSMRELSKKYSTQLYYVQADSDFTIKK